MNYLTKIAIVLSTLLTGCAGAHNELTPNIDASDLECLIFEGADIADANRPYEPADEMTMQEQLAIANQGHSIIAGSSTVIAVREFSGRNGAADSQRYKKLTATLNGPSDAEGAIGVTKSYFVLGSSAFVAWGLYHVSIDALKEVEIDHGGNRRFLTIKQKFPVIGVPDGRSDEVQVSFECELKNKPLDKLSAWEGSATSKNDPFYP